MAVTTDTATPRSASSARVPPIEIDSSSGWAWNESSPGIGGTLPVPFGAAGTLPPMKSRAAIAALLLASCAGNTAVTTPSTVTTTTTTQPAITSTTLAATTTTTPIVAISPRRDRIVIHGVGDIALCNCFHDAFRDSGYGIAFSGMDGLFLRDALTIGNLECAPADGGRLLSNKPNSFRCDVAALPLMAGAGIDVAAMGNNHSGDYGFDALLVGRQNLTMAGLHPVGAGENLEVATAPNSSSVAVGRSPWCRSPASADSPTPRHTRQAPP